MCLPEWLYEALPSLYAHDGCATAIYFDMPIGFTSGMILLLAAILVRLMSRGYRQGSVKKKTIAAVRTRSLKSYTPFRGQFLLRFMSGVAASETFPKTPGMALSG